MIMFMNNAALNVKDYIEIAGIIIGIFVGLIAIVISVKSNKISTQASLDNRMMIEESLKPTITIYPYVYKPGTLLYALVIKNVGNTTCTINNFETDSDYFKQGIVGFKNKDVTFEETISGITLGPNQSKLVHIDGLKLPDKPIFFKFEYSDSFNTYQDSTSINFDAGTVIPEITATTKNKELQRIYETLLEIMRTNI